MPGTNLTRLEAQQRAATVRTHGYDVALDLTRGAERFGAETTVRFSGTPGADTFIDVIAAEVHSVTLNGRELDPAEVFADSRIALPGLEAENTLTVVSDQLYTNTGEGLHRFVDPADGEVYLYSQFEVPDSRRMFPVFEQPDLKATFRFTVTAHVDDLAWGGPRDFSAEVPCVYDDDIERIAKSRHGDVIAYASALATLRRLDEAFVGGSVERTGGLRRLAEMHAESMRLLARDTRDAAIKEQADILAALLETTKP